MRKLCERYGVLIEGVDFGGLVDFVDSLCEPPRKSTGDKKRENSNGVDFPSPSHRKSTKSTTQHKPTPQGCGECDYYLVERGWIGCKKMEQKLRNMDSCPLEPG
jgi:hypothetical protein